MCNWFKNLFNCKCSCCHSEEKGSCCGHKEDKACCHSEEKDCCHGEEAHHENTHKEEEKVQ